MDIKRARIVVIEDERIMAALVLGGLRRMGILDLYSFENAQTALHEMRQIKPDLIITDVRMQPMNGIEFLRQLRRCADFRVAQTPVIFLSADSTPSTVHETLQLGVAGFIVKPPKMKVLEARIEQALRGSAPEILD